MEHVKYPKTMHFPWSPGLQNDDRVLTDPDCFHGKYIVVTEKMDGENTTMYRDFIHARSLSEMAPHESRTRVKAIHGGIKNNIPENFRICGENMQAKHSVHYCKANMNRVGSYFLVYSIWDGDICLGFEETYEWCKLLGLEHVPVMSDGIYHRSDLIALENWMRPDYHNGKKEGYVVRNGYSFHIKDFQTNVAKYVRKGHVQTSEHWLNEPMVENEVLRQGEIDL